MFHFKKDCWLQTPSAGETELLQTLNECMSNNISICMKDRHAQDGILPYYPHMPQYTTRHTISHLSDKNDTNLGIESAGLLCQLCPLRSSDPLLRRSLDGARVASVSPVIVSTDSERLGISM